MSLLWLCIWIHGWHTHSYHLNSSLALLLPSSVRNSRQYLRIADAWIGHMRWARKPSIFAWRPDALLAAFQDAKSFSTFIGLAGLFIYQSKVRVGFIAWFWKTGEISDQVQPQVSHHRVLLWGTDRPDSRDFLSRLFLFFFIRRSGSSNQLS